MPQLENGLGSGKFGADRPCEEIRVRRPRKENLAEAKTESFAVEGTNYNSRSSNSREPMCDPVSSCPDRMKSKNGVTIGGRLISR